jgi:hypothetical protein
MMETSEKGSGKGGQGSSGKGHRSANDVLRGPSSAYAGYNASTAKHSTKQELTEQIFETLGIPLEPDDLHENQTQPGLKSRLQELRDMKGGVDANSSTAVLDALAGLPVKHGGRAGGMHMPGTLQSRLALQA